MPSVAGTVMLDLVGDLYRRRVALEWRAAVVVAGAAVLVAVLGRFPFAGDGFWLLLGLVGVIVLAAVGLAANAYLRPVVVPSAPAQWGDRDLEAVQKQVSRGMPVDPAQLQAAAVAGARRRLRTTHRGVCLWPAVGSGLSLNIGAGGLVGGFGYFGVLLMLLGIGVLAWSGVVQRRLNALETAGGRLADHVGP